MPIVPEGSLCAAGAYDQADRDARDHAVSLGASGRGAVRAPVRADGFLPERPDDHKATGLFICQVTRRIDFRRR